MGLYKNIVIIAVLALGLSLVAGSTSVEARPLSYSSLNNGLVAFWKLDEESGTRYDSVGSNHLTDNNTVGRGAGVVGNAARFVAANSESLCISSSNFNVGSEFSVSFWWYGSGTILSKWGYLTSEREYKFREYESAFLGFLSPDGSAIYSYGLAHSVSSSGWNHFSGSYSGGVLSGYINGSYYDNLSESIFSGTVPFCLGSDINSYAFFNGLIDSVGFWNRALTSDEIAALYNGGHGQEYPFLDPTPTPSPTNTPTGTRTPTATRTATAAPSATSTSSGTCSDCWQTSTPPPGDTPDPDDPYDAPTAIPVTIPNPGNQNDPITPIPTPDFIDAPDPLAIGTWTVATPAPFNPDPINTPIPVAFSGGISLTDVTSPTYRLATPDYPTGAISSTEMVSLTTINTSLALTYSTPMPLSEFGTISGTDTITNALYETQAGAVLSDADGWLGQMMSYTNWLSGEVATLQATRTFTIASAPEWYAPDLPRPMADVGWTFELMQEEAWAGALEYSMTQWAWLGGYMVSLPFQLVKTLWTLVQFLGPLGLFITWLLVMLPMVLFIKFWVFIKNVTISLLNLLIKLFRMLLGILDILGKIWDAIPGL